MPECNDRVGSLEPTGRSPFDGEPAPEIANAWTETPQARARASEDARHGLLRRRPDLSAGAPVAIWQVLAAVVLIGLSIGGAVVAPGETLVAASVFFAVPFASIAILRAIAVREALRPLAHSAAHTSALAVGDAAWASAEATPLPQFSVLVPLHREAAVLPDLINALTAIDYPPSRLEVLLVIEEDDAATLQALAHLSLPDTIRPLLVPVSHPRTKPKALNFALAFSRGDLVAIYDAEDVPEPDQLRLAAARFMAPSPPQAPPLAVLQARLNVYNMRDSWLTRQFTLEYTALFDCLLPALVRLGLPLPLGGTSNHFARRALVQAGGWDPFNVTEDCDLGVRLARLGYAADVLPSTTWEEAPATLAAWGRQRTRWLKGWMQTWLVHIRQPLRLWRELGPWRFVGFNGVVAGMVLSALVQPVFYALLLVELTREAPFAAPMTTAGGVIWVVALFNLAAGYGAGMVLALAAIRRRRRAVRVRDILSIPLYWLLIGVVAWRALYQLLADPYRWEKTEHAARSGRERPAARPKA